MSDAAKAVTRRELLPPGGYAAIPKTILTDKRLKPASKLVYATLLDLCGPKRKHPVKDREIAEAAGLSKRAVGIAKQQLADSGLIELDSIVGRRGGCRYRFYQTASENSAQNAPKPAKVNSAKSAPNKGVNSAKSALPIRLLNSDYYSPDGVEQPPRDKSISCTAKKPTAKAPSKPKPKPPRKTRPRDRLMGRVRELHAATCPDTPFQAAQWGKALKILLARDAANELAVAEALPRFFRKHQGSGWRACFFKADYQHEADYLLSDQPVKHKGASRLAKANGDGIDYDLAARRLRPGAIIPPTDPALIQEVPDARKRVSA